MGTGSLFWGSRSDDDRARLIQIANMYANHTYIGLSTTLIKAGSAGHEDGPAGGWAEG